MLTRALRVLRRPAALPLILLAAATAADAQTGTVRVARENFRATPSGVVLAEVRAETQLPLGRRQDRWRQATLEGWVWGPSLREEAVDGHDLVVRASGGENLRSQPNGPILARLRTGMRLDRVETRDRWVRVRRTAWVWEPSLQVEAEQATPPPVPPGTPPSSGPAAPAATERGGGPNTAQAADSPGSRPAGAAQPGRMTVAGGTGTSVLENPAGDTLARVAPGASVRVLARDGEWARVRVEGWTLAASLGAPDSAATAVLQGVSPAELAAEPERFRGRLVAWELQFVALQEAERFRTDFIEGEPFILARGPGDDAGFVYVAVPPEREEEVRRLTPLQRIRIVGRVRSAASELTGAPVLDLLELRPLQND